MFEKWNIYLLFGMGCKAPRAGLDRLYTNFYSLLFHYYHYYYYYYYHWYEIVFPYSHLYKTNFHNKGFFLSLVLKARVFETRKWPIRAKVVSEKYSRHFGWNFQKEFPVNFKSNIFGMFITKFSLKEIQHLKIVANSGHG